MGFLKNGILLIHNFYNFDIFCLGLPKGLPKILVTGGETKDGQNLISTELLHFDDEPAENSCKISDLIEATIRATGGYSEKIGLIICGGATPDTVPVQWHTNHCYRLSKNGKFSKVQISV